MSNLTTKISGLVAGYGKQRPLRGYTLVLGTYTTVVSALALLGRATGARLPARISGADVVLLTIATHKASRLLTKDAVTSPLRTPFTRFDEETGMGEVNESVRGHDVRHAVGEMVTCPFCAAVWVSTALSAGLVFAPRLTRLVTMMLTAVAGSDTLQLGYDAARSWVKDFD